MRLRFEPEIQSYVGERVAVPADVFDEALRELVAGGADEQEARLFLLDEDEWLEDQPDPLVCPQCGQAVLPGMGFCNARCEAAYRGQTP